MSRQAEFEEYARARQQALFRTAYLLCGSRDGAQELVQTAFVQLFGSWSAASRADSPDAYARAVLVRSFVAQRRALLRERSAHVPVAPAPEPDSPDLRLTVLAALAQLPPRSRAVLVLRYWEDQSVEATAAALGCSTGTVKSQSARALAKLRTLLGESLHERNER